MPTFTSFANWTEQGVKNVKEGPSRTEAAKALSKRWGAGSKSCISRLATAPRSISSSG